MGNLFVKSTVKEIVNDAEIMEPIAATASSAMKQTVTNPEVMSAATAIIANPKVTSSVDLFRSDIVRELRLTRELARADLKGYFGVAREDLKGYFGVAREDFKGYFGAARADLKGYVGVAREDLKGYFTLIIGVVVAIAAAFYKRPPPPPSIPTVTLPPPQEGFEALHDRPNGLQYILLRARPKSFRVVKFLHQ